MAARKRRGDATVDLRRIARVFREEIAGRRWGEKAFEDLLAESAAAGEAVDPAEREAVRRVLSALERLSSLHLAAVAASEILERGKDGTVPAEIAVDVVATFREQSGLAAGDAFAALVAALPPAEGRTSSRLETEVARLAALRPSASDLKASLAAIAVISPRRRGSVASFATVVRDAVAAAAFVDRAVGRVEQLLAGAAQTDRRVARAALLDVMNFIARCASFAQRIVTLRLAHAGDER